MSDKNNSNDQKKITKTRSEQNSGFVLFSFLEKESERLSKLLIFFQEKCLSLKRFPQTKALIAQEEKRRDLLQKELLTHLNQPDSVLTKNISEILKSHFSN